MMALTDERDELHRWAEGDTQTLAARVYLLAIVTHDLRNALTVIKGNVQISLRHMSSPSWSTERIGADLTRVDRSVSAMERQVDQLSDLSLMLGGRSPSLDLVPCDLVALALQAATDFRATTDRHSIRVNSAAPQLLGIWDSLRMARALANLLSNAIKYSPQAGEIEVTVATEKAPNGEAAVIKVRDHGIGIPASDLPLVFTPFHRAANVGRVDGSGLGLASVKQVADLHGGTVVAESHVGLGTTITIRLPLATPSDVAARLQ